MPPIMYNEKTKKAFLNTLPTDSLEVMYNSLFSRSAHIEDMTDKDILHFNINECAFLLKYLNPKSIRQIGSLKSQFTKYANWGIKQNIVSQNNWLLIPPDGSFAKHSFTTRYVKDMDELESLVDTGLSAPYDKYVVYLLYMGIMGESYSELANLKDSDVSIHNKTIMANRQKYAIIDPLYKTITRQDYYKEAKRRNYESAYFIKPYNTKHIKDGPISYQHIFRVFSKLNKECGKANQDKQISLSPMTIWRSGLFNSLYQIERIKGNIVSDDYKYVSEVYGNKNSYSSYLRDYELYKELFWGVALYVY